MKIVIIGAGLIGCERIEAVQYISKLTNNKISLLSVFDINNDLLLKVQNKYNVNISSNLDESLSGHPDWVFISTPNDVVLDIAKKAFQVGANVLVEKPFGRTLSECEQIIKLKPANAKLHVGFNYRFFAGVESILHDTKSGKFGKLISANLTLGHSNSPGMEKSWKLDPLRCGGVVTDLGVHLFDLILQISSGNVNVNFAKSWVGYWNTGIEEEAHLLLSDDSGAIFNTQVSLNRWRNTFKFEVNGTEGYGVVEGRGKNYGPQSYKTGVRWGWLSGKAQAETESLIIDKNDCKDSFLRETMSVLGFDKVSTSSSCDFNDGRNIMKLLNQYDSLIK